MNRPGPMANAIALARATRRPVQIGTIGVAVELPDGDVVAVVQSRGKLHLLTLSSLAPEQLDAVNGFDFASCAAGHLASIVWQLHQLCERGPHLVAANDAEIAL